MGYPQPVLELPPVSGDNAAEIEAEIKRMAYEFYGPDAKLALPQRYHAKLTGDARWSKTKKLYVVEGLTVGRDRSGWRNTLSRQVDLPPVSADGVLGIEAAIERVAIEFFGSDGDITPCTTMECKVQVVTSPPDGKKYKVEGVSLRQSAEWPEA